MPQRIKTAVIPSAGLGTRFLPATKAIPKELVPIVDKPAIQYIVEECVRAGFERIVFVISKGKESISSYFKRSKALESALEKRGRSHFITHLNEITKKIKFSVVYQNKPRGLGDAVLKAREVVKANPFAVILPDDVIVSVTPAIGQLVEIWEERGQPAISLERVARERVSSYGVVSGTKIEERLYRLTHIVEKPRIEDAPSDLIIVGRYVLPPETFEILKDTKPAKGGEIQLTDALSTIMRERELLGFEFYGDRYDVGDRNGFINHLLFSMIWLKTTGRFRRTRSNRQGRFLDPSMRTEAWK
jgi:UTP--glucose-1-phosphate uridylyltransferase